MKSQRKKAVLPLAAATTVAIVAGAMFTTSAGSRENTTGPASRTLVRDIIQGRITFHEAARTGNLDALSYFVDDGVELDAYDTNGETALHYAAYSGQTEAVRLLLLVGASSSAVDATGKTPLQVAKAAGRADTAKLLYAIEATR